jgi:hypothetical protein
VVALEVLEVEQGIILVVVVLEFLVKVIVVEMHREKQLEGEAEKLLQRLVIQQDCVEMV